MVKIELMNDHRLVSDSKQWIFQKKSKKLDKYGNEDWRSLYYNTTIESAVKSAYRHFQNTQDANGVLEFMEGSKRLLDQFTAILSPKFTVIEK